MFFDDIKLNTQIDIPPAVIEKDKMVEFAKLYDNIPLHVDEDYAKSNNHKADREKREKRQCRNHNTIQ